MAKPRLPVSLTEPGERLLAWANIAPEGTVLLASTHAMYIPAVGDITEPIRVPWVQIDRATWEDPEVVVEALIDGVARRWRITLEAPGRVPEVVRERVMATIVFSEHVDLLEGAGARIVGRRGDADAPVEWTITFDPGLDPEDPGLREMAVQALSDLRESLGI